MKGKWRGKDTVEVACLTIEIIEAEEPDAVVVDGDGLGAGVVDQLKHRGFGRKLFEFHGGATPDDVNKYFNRRAEAWGLMRDWLQAGADIPDDPEIDVDLTGPDYFFSPKGQIQLEPKDAMKARGLDSPDIGDCGDVAQRQGTSAQACSATGVQLSLSFGYCALDALIGGRCA